MRFERLARARQQQGRRQAAQNLVEFGLIVAAVSILGMAGLQVLGRAEENYFVPLSRGLAPQAPVGTDDVVHPTRVTIDCTPTTVIVGNQATCTFTVSDTWPTKRTWPRGDVQLLVNGAATGIACSLAQDTSTGDAALGKCVVSWPPAVSNVPSAVLAAHYVPNDGAHAAPTTDPSETLTVQQQVILTFTPGAGQTTACWNTEGPIGGDPEAVEVGHPIVCHLTVTDQHGNPVPSTPVQVSEVTSAPGGQPFFSCFTNGTRSLYYSQCSPAAATFVGTTNASGQLTFVYRRYYDALASTLTDTFTASSIAYPASPTVTHAIKIVPPVAGPHPTELVVRCYSNVNGSPASWVSGLGLTVESDTGLQGRNGDTVPCAAAVFDVDPTNVYRTSNLDGEDAYSPSGWVYWLDDQGHPVIDDTGHPAACQLNWGNSIGAPYLPLQVNGLPDYAATCTVRLKPTGDHTLTAHYDGNSAPYPAHSSSVSRPLSSDFD